MDQSKNTSNQLGSQNKFLAIEVNGYGFGIPIDWVREIVFNSKINPLPQMPNFVSGVALIRDETIPVLDLNILLGGRAATPIHNESCFIVVQFADSNGKLTQVCLLADRVLQNYKIDQDDLDPAPVLKDETIVQYVIGIGRVGGDIYILIDPVNLILPYLNSLGTYKNYVEDCTEEAGSKDNQDDEVFNLTNKKYKYLSVFVGEEEYAFPMSGVSQIVAKSELTGFDDDDMPEFLHGAAIYGDKPIAIVSLNEVVTDNVKSVKGEHELNSLSVIILIDFHNGMLGIMVDRIGKTYETDKKLKQHSLCNDLVRERIKSLGFIDKEGSSIEVIEPSGVLSDSEQSQIQSWMGCIERMVEMTGRVKNIEETEESLNPLAVHAGSYLVVQVGNEMIALQSSDVDEVLSYDNLIPICNGPDWFMGLLDLRQCTYPVIDLHQRLDIPYNEKTEESRKVLVMIKDEGNRVGLYVDRIVKSNYIHKEQLTGCESSTLVVKPGVLNAVAKIDIGIVNIINLKSVVGRDEISARRLLEELKNMDDDDKDLSVSNF